jgi:hypothetical protein
MAVLAVTKGSKRMYSVRKHSYCKQAVYKMDYYKWKVTGHQLLAICHTLTVPFVGFDYWATMGERK